MKVIPVYSIIHIGNGTSECPNKRLFAFSPEEEYQKKEEYKKIYNKGKPMGCIIHLLNSEWHHNH